ncbi:MAG TPA: ATP-dependent Clp protease adaptor ClpS, partial [Pirellulaceae bacterium]|nr:ATP-dependent Clp protease adaptor ClpS [Pirellulaceae bacterium]
MSEPIVDLRHLDIVFHNDDVTPVDFVVGLLTSVFGRSDGDAAQFVASVDQQGKATCGTYRVDVANELLTRAQNLIKREGHPLIITAEATNSVSNDQPTCAFCGTIARQDQTVFTGRTAAICDECTLVAANHLSEVTKTKAFRYGYEALAWHFAGIPHDSLVTTTRQFPGHMRADIQVAIDGLFSVAPIRFFGIYEQHRYETLTFASLTRAGQHAPTIAPAQYQDVDIGDDQPVKCLNNGLWLCRDGDMRYAVVLSFHREYGHEAGMCVEIAVPAGEEGSVFVGRCFKVLEETIDAARSYRGKVLSLEGDNNYTGRSTGVTVHRLPPVERDEVILPPATLKLLDRNVLSFVGIREKLRSLGQSTRKGILLYGPPGTGKTHTIRYLASQLPGHTTLIITAAQVALLADYMTLARLLQPAMVVIEDVDLIARAREKMVGPCEESLLNRLLNEMDGLKQDADIIFVLTTNRPEQLEGALAGRPGRIDQAIEVPLPDDEGRAKLVRLYGKGLALDAPVVDEDQQGDPGDVVGFQAGFTDPVNREGDLGLIDERLHGLGAGIIHTEPQCPQA